MSVGLKDLLQDFNSALKGKFRICTGCDGRGRIKRSNYNPWPLASAYWLHTERKQRIQARRCPDCNGTGNIKNTKDKSKE